MPLVDGLRRAAGPGVWPGLAAAVLGGLIGWSLVYAGAGTWGLLAGVATAVGTVAFTTRRGTSGWATAAGYAFAFILLTWPVLWIAIGLIRYWTTGQSIEN